MPAYGARVFCVEPGHSYKVFDAESPAAGASSVAVAIPPALDGALAGYSVACQFASAPDAVSILVQEADEDVEASYVTVDTLSSVTGGKTSYSGNITNFVRLKLSSQTNGGAVTATIGR
jgi:hypothetical protein